MSVAQSRVAQLEIRELVFGLVADGVTGVVQEEPCGCTTLQGEVAQISHVCRRYEPCGCVPMNGEDVEKICPFHGQYLIDHILVAGAN